MSTFWTIFTILDRGLFLIVGLSVLYIVAFSLFSLRKKQFFYKPAQKKRHFLIIIPAYAEDKVIVESARQMQELTYPKELFHTIVVSDHHTPETNQVLNMLPIENIIATYANSSKAKALQLAMSKQNEDFDYVVILDADNIVEPDFLNRLNEICESGYNFIQCHRVARPTLRQTAVARLDAISEEINNSIFRKGHINIGLSSALIGSGMCLDFQWFKTHVGQLSTTGEDKELEQMLLHQRMHIHYAEDIYVYDEKVKKSGNFQQQRRRWMAVQVQALLSMVRGFSGTIHPINWNYWDKTFQQAILPRLLNLFLLFAFSLITTVINPTIGAKWILMAICFCLALFVATPKHYKNTDTLKALSATPKLVLVTVLNLFHLEGAVKTFIHTEHGE